MANFIKIGLGYIHRFIKEEKDKEIIKKQLNKEFEEM